MPVNTTINVQPPPGFLTTDAAINILIVDHCPENLLSLEGILKKEGRNIIKSSTVKEALNIAFNKPIAIILINVQMPDVDVFEAAQSLKNNPVAKDANILFITPHTMKEQFTLRGFEEGVVDFLYTPFDAAITQARIGVYEKLYLQQEALREKTTKLEAINKNLDEFVYIVSHDLKAPLRGISSLANFVEDDLGANINPSVTDTLHMMKSRCNRMQNLIDGILHYSRMGNTSSAPEEVDINELLKNILDMICPPANIKITLQENMPVVMGEKIKLHEIFQNLISNGIKYNNKEQGAINVSYTDLGGFYEFAIADNGSGIKEEHYEKIFGIFQTLQPKDKVESTGIGLTIVKKLVEQQGGKVTVESRHGEGSVFKFNWKK